MCKKTKNDKMSDENYDDDYDGKYDNDYDGDYNDKYEYDDAKKITNIFRECHHYTAMH